MQNLNLKHLYYFWMIAKEGGIKQAAQVLHLSQSTLSDQLKKLEGSFGKSLFDRQSKRMILTPVGVQVEDYATRIFSLRNELIDKVREEISLEQRVLRVGVVRNLARNMTIFLILPLLKRPELFTKIVDNDLAELFNELTQGQLDLIFCDQLVPTRSKSIYTKKIIDRSFYLVTSKDRGAQLLAGEKNLNDIPYITYSRGTDLNFRVKEYINSQKLSSSLMAEMDDVRLMLDAVEADLCWCILPRRAIQRSLAEGKSMIYAEIKPIHSAIYGVYTNPNLSDYFDEIREYIRQN
ncbi:MAG: hypothetical protein A2451_11530, partial [Bdellovibrionales bacterium RIFOXYC2_FULL_39_8]